MELRGGGGDEEEDGVKPEMCLLPSFLCLPSFCVLGLVSVVMDTAAVVLYGYFHPSSTKLKCPTSLFKPTSQKKEQ